MLKTFEKLDDVPEGLREHYKLIDGKYVPEVSDDHPLKTTNAKLLNEKNTAESKASGLETTVNGLTADLESARASGVPRGHKVVTNAEAEAITTLKEHGTATEIATKLGEHKTLSEKVARQERETLLREVAQELGYDNTDAFVRLPGLPNFEIREKDGKKTVVAKVKGEGDVITEKPAQEFIESSAEIKPFLSALKTSSGGMYVPEQRRDNGDKSGDIYTRTRERVKAEQESRPVGAVKERFGFAKTV